MSLNIPLFSPFPSNKVTDSHTLIKTSIMYICYRSTLNLYIIAVIFFKIPVFK